jgi:hypothetical protein
MRCLACALFLAGGCGDNPARVVPEKPLRLSAETSAVSVRSGGMVALRFTLNAKSGGVVSGERVEFAAIRETDVAGATLSGASALTDGQGVATVNLTAGRPTKFEIAAQNPRAEPARATITVFESQVATLSVLVELDDGFVPPRTLARTELSLYPDQLCSTLSPILLPAAPGGVTVAVLGTPTDIRIDRMRQTALLGRAYDAGGALQAVGCIDVTNSTVLPSVNGHVSLLLAAVPLLPGPSYRLSAHFSLAKRNIAARIAAPWQDLTDCPLDPAQLWLDCALDALGTAAGGVIDCLLPPAAAEVSPLALAIEGRRGAFPAGSAACRTAVLADGAASLDARLAALFPSPALSPARDLDSIAQLAAQVLDDFVVTSTLRLDPTGSAGLYHGTHSLRGVIFSIGGQSILADVLALGIPASEARFIDILAVGSTLTVGEHHLALRIGTLSQQAFEQAAAARLGLEPGTRFILEALFGLAATEPGPARKTGCDALDAVVCADVGASPGCMLGSCVLGQAALGTLLSSGFRSADGDGADLQLTGTLDMVDTNADGVADVLGAGPTARWLAQFRSSGPTESVTGALSAVPP